MEKATLDEKNHVINEYKQSVRDLERFAVEELKRRIQRAITAGRQVKLLTGSTEVGQSVARLEDQLRYENEAWPGFIKQLLEDAERARTEARAMEVPLPSLLFEEETGQKGGERDRS